MHEMPFLWRRKIDWCHHLPASLEVGAKTFCRANVLRCGKLSHLLHKASAFSRSTSRGSSPRVASWMFHKPPG